MTGQTSPPRQNLIFLGSGAFGLPTLQALARDHTLLAVVTQPDKPAGRGMKLTPTPIGQWAVDNLADVPLLKPVSVNDPAVLTFLRQFPADAWVVIAFGQKLSDALLHERFAINLHASLLPRWRGAAPINAAMLAGDAVTGNSVITLAQKMDAGLILGQSSRAVEPHLSAGELHDLLAQDGPALVQDVLARHAAGVLKPVTQDESLVTKARKLSRADGQLDFSRPALHLRHQVHGLTPWPGVTVQIEGRSLKLLRVSEAELRTTAAPGTLVDLVGGLVAAAPGTALRVQIVQPAGGKPMPWKAYAAGNRISPNTTVSSASISP